MNLYRGGLDKSRRGQAAVEYLVWIAPLMLLVAVLYANALSDSVQTINFNKANDAVDTLAKAADTVYSMGPGSKIFTVISNPDGIVSQKISGHTIVYKMSLPDDAVVDVVSPTKGWVKGFIPKDQRSYNVPVKMLDSGVIMVGWGMLMEPAELYLVVPEGEQSNYTSLNLTNERVNLTNSMDDYVADIGCNVSGDAGNWTVTSNWPSDLDPGESGEVELVFEVPPAQLSGLYYGLIECTSNDSVAETPVTIEVPRDFSMLTVETLDQQGQPETSFNQTYPVYYEINFFDHSNNNMPVDAFNITIANQTHIMQTLDNLTTSSDTPYEGVYFLAWNATPGTYEINVSATDHNGYTTHKLENQTQFTVSKWEWLTIDECPWNCTDINISLFDAFEDKNDGTIRSRWHEQDSGHVGRQFSNCGNNFSQGNCSMKVEYEFPILGGFSYYMNRDDTGVWDFNGYEYLTFWVSHPNMTSDNEELRIGMRMGEYEDTGLWWIVNDDYKYAYRRFDWEKESETISFPLAEASRNDVNPGRIDFIELFIAGYGKGEEGALYVDDMKLVPYGWS
ncbi:MAG: hypothetical protein ABH950_09640 [Candidatus Altiarchaeota archaeon]